MTLIGGKETDIEGKGDKEREREREKERERKETRDREGHRMRHRWLGNRRMSTQRVDAESEK